MNQDHNQVRVVHPDVVRQHGPGVHNARARKNRRACVDHHRESEVLRAGINCGEGLQPVAVGVRCKELVRGMHLQRPDADARQAIDGGGCIGNVIGMHGSKGDQSAGFCGTIARVPVVHLCSVADDLRADGGDQPGAFNARDVEKIQEGQGIGRELPQPCEIVLGAF